MLGDGLGTLERLPALPAMVIVRGHGHSPANAVGRKDLRAAGSEKFIPERHHSVEGLQVLVF
jgi:hypothetical protein